VPAREHQQTRWAKLQPDRCGVGREVDPGKDREAALGDRGFEPRPRVGDRTLRGQQNHPGGNGRGVHAPTVHVSDEERNL